MGLLYEPMGKGPATRTASVAADIRDLAEDLMAELDDPDGGQHLVERISVLQRTLYQLEIEPVRPADPD